MSQNSDRNMKTLWSRSERPKQNCNLWHVRHSSMSFSRSWRKILLRRDWNREKFIFGIDDGTRQTISCPMNNNYTIQCLLECSLLLGCREILRSQTSSRGIFGNFLSGSPKFQSIWNSITFNLGNALSDHYVWNGYSFRRFSINSA